MRVVEAIADTIHGFPFELAELEWLGCKFPDGVTVQAEARPDLKWRFLFEGYHPRLGRLFFRLRRRGSNGAVELWEVTEPLSRLFVWRNRRARRRRGESERAQWRRAHGSLPVSGSPGRPSAARRRQGPLARETLADPESGRDILAWRAPDRIEAMLKRGALSQRQRDMALRFHRAFIAGGLHPGRAYDLLRVRTAISGTGPAADATLDAKDEVFGIYDHLGGRGSLGARLLYHVIGMDRSIEDCVRIERGGGERTNKHKALGVLTTALDGVAGYYATRGLWLKRVERLKAAETQARMQGA
jgi:hypothetical protein